MHASDSGKAKALAAGILHCKAPVTSDHVEELLGKAVRLELDASRGDGSAVVPFLCHLWGCEGACESVCKRASEREIERERVCGCVCVCVCLSVRVGVYIDLFVYTITYFMYMQTDVYMYI